MADALSRTQVRSEALSAVTEENEDRVTSLIRSWVRDQVEAEDIWQDVVGELVEAYDVGDTIERWSAWLVKVARNKVIDRFRRRQTERKSLAASGNEEQSADDPEQEYIRFLLREKIAEAIDLLPDPQRLVFIQHELEGKSFEEISELTGDSVNTLISRKRYAVLFLRTYLKEVYDEL